MKIKILTLAAFVALAAICTAPDFFCSQQQKTGQT